jgi:hypothetical protein
MAVEEFTKDQFESALPAGRWDPLGLVDGEYSYLMRVKSGVAIVIRSSEEEWGISAPSGEDSIRAWLVHPDTLEPLGAKRQRWVTRVPGWGKRLTVMLRRLWRLGLRVGACPACSGTRKVFQTRQGSNKGKWFIKCDGCRHFEWINLTISEPRE